MTLTLMIAGHRIGHYSAEGKLLTPLSQNKSRPNQPERLSHQTSLVTDNPSGSA